MARYPRAVNMKKSALILGSTGETGNCLLNELLLSPHFDRVGEYGRMWVLFFDCERNVVRVDGTLLGID
jgi:hypothetical protein